MKNKMDVKYCHIDDEDGEKLVRSYRMCIFKDSFFIMDWILNMLIYHVVDAHEEFG